MNLKDLVTPKTGIMATENSDLNHRNKNILNIKYNLNCNIISQQVLFLLHFLSHKCSLGQQFLRKHEQKY